MRLIIYILLPLFLITSLYGQENKINIGFEGSPSVIYLRGKDFAKDNHYPSIGFSGGLFFQYGFQKNLSIRTNISFERKGSLTDMTITDPNGFIIGQYAPPNYFDYLTIPILLRTTFGSRVKYFINAGSFCGFLIKQTIVYKDIIEGNAKHTKSTSDNTSQYKRFDTGISVGFGIFIPIKKKFAISFEIRNNLGLLNVMKRPANNNNTIKTNSTNLLIGFTYKLK